MLTDKLSKMVPDEHIRLQGSSWQSISNIIEFSEPIKPRSIPHFSQWIRWNGYAEDHHGLDISAYVNSFGEGVLGLPPRTPVYSLLDGIVISIERMKVMEEVVDPYDHYQDTIIVAHGHHERKPSLLGIYGHVSPTVKEGDCVKKGQKIGKLYADLSNFDAGRLVHLHLGLANFEREMHYENLEQFFPWTKDLETVPQREPNFTIPKLGGEVNIRLANFGTLYYGNGFMVRAKEFKAPAPTYSLMRRGGELLSARK